MNAADAWPYLKELRLLCGQALALFHDIVAQRDDWLRLRSPGPLEGDEGETQSRAISDAQSKLGWDLDHFLTLHGRASLILMPTSDSEQPRGKTLRRLLGIRDDHQIIDRELRNAVIHQDERMDHAVLRKGFGSARAFVDSSGVATRKSETLLLFDVEALHVHFFCRDGSQAVRDMAATRDALRDILDRISGAEAARIEEMRRDLRNQGAG